VTAVLGFAQARIRVGRHGQVAVSGDWKRYTARIADFVSELGLRRASITYYRGRYRFSRNVDPSTQQRLRNFLVNRCPI